MNRMSVIGGSHIQKNTPFCIEETYTAKLSDYYRQKFIQRAGLGANRTLENRLRGVGFARETVLKG
jgi:hypothetical protein